MKGRLKREIEKKNEDIDRVEIIDADYSKARSYITFRFNNNNNALTQTSSPTTTTLRPNPTESSVLCVFF